MFGVFKSKWTRAVEGVADFIPKMLAPYGKVPADALRDPYCLGFLQMVGVHVASQSLDKGEDMEKAKAVFEEALKQFAPRYAHEAAEVLPILHSNEAYLRGKKDGDLYMGWKLLHLAPQRDGEAALERFFDRVRYITAQRMNSAQIAEAQKLATEGTKHDHRNSTDAEINAIFVPLRDQILDFKDATKISWLVILPAMNKMSARLLVKSRGLENTRRLYAHILASKGTDTTGQVPSGAILGVTASSFPPDNLAQVNELLWKIANDMIAKGYPIEHIAQAFGGFVAMIGEKAVDALYVTTLMVETYKELQSNDFV